MTTDLRRLTHTNNNSYTIVLMPILCNRHLNKEDFKSRRESYYYYFLQCSEKLKINEFMNEYFLKVFDFF